MKPLEIALVIVLIILLLYIWNDRDTFVSIIAPDGERYSVTGNDYKKSAEMLAWINSQNIELMRYMRDKYPNSIYTINLRKRYDPAIVSEHLPTALVPETSFVERKDQHIGFCLRGGYNPNGDSPMTTHSNMMFVNLHELSHVAVNGTGHGRPFWEAFKFILEAAKACGIYQPIDYAIKPIVYCGMNVTYNPYFDESLN